MTFATKTELGTRTLGTDRLARGRANCSIKTHSISVPLFDGLGEQFTLYASRLRVRGGFTGTFMHSHTQTIATDSTIARQRTSSAPVPRSLCAAIDPRACSNNPKACGAVQRVLERVCQPAPRRQCRSLVSLVPLSRAGPDAHVHQRAVRSRSLDRVANPAAAAAAAAALRALHHGMPIQPHAYTPLTPSNPGWRAPDPRPCLHRAQPPPPPHPPTPSPPPPWYSGSETCFPISTAAENDIDVADGLERAVCVYVRAIANERVRASKCFGAISPSPPPPPPKAQGELARLKAALLKRQVRRGGTSGATDAVALSDEEEYAREAQAAAAAQLEYLDTLASDSGNAQLREILQTIRGHLGDTAPATPTPSGGGYYGRRLWQRTDDATSHRIVDNILSTTAFGTSPIVGVTVAQCEALCAAIDNSTVGQCKGIAFARADGANPRDPTLRQCILLRDLGGCSPATFAGAVFARRDTDGCTDPTAYDNPLCVQLASDRTDLRVLDYASAEQSCRNGKGRPKVAWPKTALEAFSMLGYAREHGITAFWSASPPEGGTMAWTGDDGQPLVIPPGNKRCVLVSTVSTDPHGYMYGELHSCKSRLADGVVCESAMAFPPPPPGGTGLYPPPPPPPPPLHVTASLSWYTRRTILPRTAAVCEAGLVDADIAKLCYAFAAELGQPARSGLVSTFMPLCQPVCWHSCMGASNQDRDGFHNCKDAACADTACIDFLMMYANAPRTPFRHTLMHWISPHVAPCARAGSARPRRTRCCSGTTTARAAWACRRRLRRRRRRRARRRRRTHRRRSGAGRACCASRSRRRRATRTARP